VSPFVDEVGLGYVVLRLPPPPRWLDLLRLGALLVVMATLVLMLFFIVHVASTTPATTQAEEYGIADAIMIAILAVPGLWVGVAIVAQARVLGGRLRRSLQTTPPITLRNDRAGGAVTIVDAEVAHDSLRTGGRAFLRVHARDGRTIELLRGHRTAAIEKVAQDLHAILLRDAHRAGGPRTDAAVGPGPWTKWNPK
jgi:hypothetical protein